MNGPVTFEALSERFRADQRSRLRGDDGAIERLTRAFDAIGWRSSGGDSSDGMAALADMILLACITGHRNPGTAARNIADLMRQGYADLDGSMPPASAFLPAAEEVLRRYVAPTPVGGGEP